MSEVRNAALEEAAELVRNHGGENFVGIGGNMGWRKLSRAQLADAILDLRDSADDESSISPEAASCEDKARRALDGLRSAMRAGIIVDDGPHRVRLGDGSIVEGRAATEWRALMLAIIDLADGVLGQSEP
jgi:hypothetical protein